MHIGANRDCDEDQVGEIVLALLSLGLWDEGQWGAPAWKGYDWKTFDRLHAQGFLAGPKAKAKSVVLTREGVARARELHFANAQNGSAA